MSSTTRLMFTVLYIYVLSEKIKYAEPQVADHIREETMGDVLPPEIKHPGVHDEVESPENSADSKPFDPFEDLHRKAEEMINQHKDSSFHSEIIKSEKHFELPLGYDLSDQDNPPVGKFEKQLKDIEFNHDILKPFDEQKDNVEVPKTDGLPPIQKEIIDHVLAVIYNKNVGSNLKQYTEEKEHQEPDINEGNPHETHNAHSHSDVLEDNKKFASEDDDIGSHTITDSKVEQFQNKQEIQEDHAIVRRDVLFSSFEKMENVDDSMAMKDVLTQNE